MKRFRLSRPLTMAFILSVPLAALSSGCSDDSSTTTGTTNPTGSGGNGGTGGSGGDGGSGGAMGGSGGAGGQEVKRGPVSFTTSPVLTARVGDLYTYAATAEQEMAQPGDVITYSLAKAPSGLTVAANGELTWTPATGQEGPHDVSLVATGPDGQSATQDFSIDVAADVGIVHVWPAAGSAAGNESVKIGGYGFVGNVDVFFGDIPAGNITVVSDTEIDVTTPPAIAKTRIVTVTIDGMPLATFSPGFTHLPLVTSTDVSSAKLSSTLKVQGFGFDTVATDPDVLAIPGRSGTRRKIVTSSVSPSELSFSLGIGNSESTITTGAFAVEINGLRSNHWPLTITDATIAAEPSVTSSDGPHAPGESIVLGGAGFGTNAAQIMVTFAGSAAPVAASNVDATGTQITVPIPADAVTGPVSVSVAGGAAKRSYVAASITGTTPILTVLDATPAGGAPGSALVLRGVGFSTDPAGNLVTFDGVEAKILSAEANRLVVEVPAVAFGPADVVVDSGGQSTSAGVFGVVGDYEILAGGGPEETDIGDGGDPKLATIASGYVATDAQNNYYLTDGTRLRAINTGNASITLFGKTIMPNTIQTIAQAATNLGAVAIHPVSQDAYFATSTQILRASRIDGSITVVTGKTTAGNSGTTITSASFDSITDLQFAAGGQLLLVADNNNGLVRVVNLTTQQIDLWGLSIGADAVLQVLNLGGPMNPIGIAVDAEGSIYASAFNQIRKVPFDRLPLGAPGYAEFVVVAGNAGSTSLPAEGCPAISTSLGVNNGIVIDPVRGDAYIGSRHALVRRMSRVGGSSPTTLDADDCIDFVAGNWEMGKPIPNAGYAGDGGSAKAATLALFSRPFVDRKGDLLIPAEGRLRRVSFDVDGNPLVIDAVAGVGPANIDNLPGKALRNVGILSSVRVDGANNRYLFTDGARLLGLDRTTGLLDVLAGTGHLGNTMGMNGMATASDLASARGFEFTSGSVYMLEAVLPRISRIDLGLGTLDVVAGDGVIATLAEQQVAGPANTSRVAINTGGPKVVVGPSGGLYFADQNLLRVVNPTNQAIDTFGVTIAPGEIDDIPVAGLGGNLSGLAFDANGDLYIASYDTNRISRLRSAAPYMREDVVLGDGQRYGHAASGLVSSLQINRPVDLAFTPNGHLLIANDFGNTILAVEPDANGVITGSSRFAHVFGSGAPGRIGAGYTSLSTTPRGARSVTVDGQRMVIIVGDRLISVVMP
ncbi:MAG: IPT/TIG domain-containing protein [Polyangiaceae bacterium]|nr:IPT/TIG domain-containing protein [Polyangiaceae bacterium]